MKKTLIIATSLFAISLLVQANQKPAWTIDKTPLLAQPQQAASTISSLEKDQTVTVLQRVRAWYQVKTEQGSEGWVRMLALRFEAPSNDSGFGIKSLWDNVASSGTETTVATGVRGFDEEDLNNASPNMQDVEKLENYQASATQAKAFAKQGKLNSNNISED